MHKSLLVFVIAACVSHGRQLQAPSPASQESVRAFTESSSTALSEAEANDRATTALRRCASFLLALLPDSSRAFQIGSSHHNARASAPGGRVDVSPVMKWDVDVAPWNIEYGQQSSPVALPADVVEGQAPQPFTITDEQRKILEEDGALHIKGLLNDQWLEYLRGATDWQVSNPHFWSAVGVASGIYDYIQRSVWASNDAFANFMYYSPLASALAGCAEAEELRLATDLLMVNPNKGFKWHQDNQNGPIDAFQDGTALRWWVTMDDCPPDHGAPVYLKGSHRNTGVSSDAVFVDLERDGLLQYPDLLEFRPKAGDLIVWHPKAIHKIDGPATKDWDASKRRVLGGTVAIDNTPYLAKGRLLFSDMGSHGLEDGDPLKHALFPKIYPISDPSERAERAAGGCTRTAEGVTRMMGNMLGSAGELLSWTKVTNE